MDEDGALLLARALTRRGVSCRVVSVGSAAHTVLVGLDDGTEAAWDVGEDAVEARVLREGALIGFVSLPRQGEVSPDATAALIAAERYQRLSTAGSSGTLADPGQRAASGGALRGSRAARAARSGRPAALLTAMVLVLLLLYLLDGRM